MSDCTHEHIVDPPPGKHLRICLDCANRVMECGSCDAVLVAGPDVGDSGWTKQQWKERFDDSVTTVYVCPRHNR